MSRNAMREGQLLEMLEQLRRAGVMLTVEEFARRAGYANRSGLRHFPRLRQALHQYCVTDRGVKHVPRLEQVEQQRRAEAQESKRQQASIALLERRLAEAQQWEARWQAERDAHKATLGRVDVLRGLIGALMAQVVGHDAQRAEQIERDLLATVREILKGDAESTRASTDAHSVTMGDDELVDVRVPLSQRTRGE